jgi:hypothetical protein
LFFRRAGFARLIFGPPPSLGDSGCGGICWFNYGLPRRMNNWNVQAVGATTGPLWWQETTIGAQSRAGGLYPHLCHRHRGQGKQTGAICGHLWGRPSAHRSTTVIIGPASKDNHGYSAILKPPCSWSQDAHDFAFDHTIALGPLEILHERCRLLLRYHDMAPHILDCLRERIHPRMGYDHTTADEFEFRKWKLSTVVSISRCVQIAADILKIRGMNGHSICFLLWRVSDQATASGKS